MKLIKKLDLTPVGINVVGSESAVGKTSLLCIVAAEFLMGDKKVLFLTNELSKREIYRKIEGKLASHNTSVFKTGFIKIIKFTDIKKVLEEEFRFTTYHVVVIDDTIVNIDYDFVVEFTKSHNCCFLISTQLRKHLGFTNHVPITNRLFQISDNAISMTKKTFTFWEKVKYFIFFWLKKPNRNLRIIKNRFGKQDSFDVYLDFEKSEIK